MDSIQTVLSALDVFSRAPDKASLETANSWLQDFQHSSEAWATCNVLLLSPEAPHAAKIFAAQTFRSKVTYDLTQVDVANIPSLRDTLITALQQYQTGPRTIIVQLCLALIGLALQYPEWQNPVQQIVETFGKNPTTVPVLLQFLTLLPEELSSATRYPLTDDDLFTKSSSLLTANSQQVVGLLAMYLQAPGVTASVQEQVFNCLRSWLNAGEVSPSKLAETPLFAFAFDALASDQLFDAATNVICDLIHETQEVDNNMPVIQLIVPRVIALRPQLSAQSSDPDKIKGFARIFSEAGYTYRALVVQHTEVFFPIVEAIGECSAYHDLDIVPITFPFWMQLANHFQTHQPVPPIFQNAYQSLMTVIINHLHFPPDSSPLTGQEADDFRAFRHVMGDTLKDCCVVLGSDTCLLAAHAMISNALSQGSNVTWQDIEAPLFGLRSMGAEVNPEDEGAVPKIMDLIPTLPDHPKVRFATLLIISRYTEWISHHPTYISFQLQYISAGFDSGDLEVSSAAGMALKFLCQDCKKHLTDFLPTLHTFLQSSGAKLHHEDKVQVYEAIAHVISAMPMDTAASSFRQFSDDILSELLAVTNKAAVTKDQMASVCGSLENLEAMLFVIRGFGEDLPSACKDTVTQTWSVFDGFLAKYGNEYDVAERTNRVLRWGIPFYGRAGRAVAPAVVRRLAALFDTSEISSYLWICGKLVQEYGHNGDEFVRGALLDVYQRSTQRLATILQTKLPTAIPDILEDYVHLAGLLLYHAPDVFFHPATFELAFKICIPILGVVYNGIVAVALDLFRDILAYDEFGTTSPYTAVIRSTFLKEGLPLISAVLDGLVGDFYEEKTGAVVSILRSATVLWPTEVMGALPSILGNIHNSKASADAKSTFLLDMGSIVKTGQYDKVRYTVLTLRRATRKARDRRQDFS
ncbi:ARM repeat-containing protein [Hymenopellis radicata]|nr:ARM repeat-containing protein [Hymenopellis radicata]